MIQRGAKKTRWPGLMVRCCVKLLACSVRPISIVPDLRPGRVLLELAQPRPWPWGVVIDGQRGSQQSLLPERWRDRKLAPCRRRRPLHNRHSRERRPLHNRHCRTSPTVIPAKAGIQGGAPGWRGLLHFHDLALHRELRKGLRRRESRVDAGWRGSLPFHNRALHEELRKGLPGLRAPTPALPSFQEGRRAAARART